MSREQVPQESEIRVTMGELIAAKKERSSIEKEFEDAQSELSQQSTEEEFAHVKNMNLRRKDAMVRECEAFDRHLEAKQNLYRKDKEATEEK